MLQVVAAVARILMLGGQRLEAAPAYAVAVRCKFDLDHLGAHFAQQPRTGWPGDELGEIQHAVALEHPWIIRHQSNLQSGSDKTTENFRVKVQKAPWIVQSGAAGGSETLVDFGCVDPVGPRKPAPVGLAPPLEYPAPPREARNATNPPSHP